MIKNKVAVAVADVVGWTLVKWPSKGPLPTMQALGYLLQAPGWPAETVNGPQAYMSFSPTSLSFSFGLDNEPPRRPYRLVSDLLTDIALYALERALNGDLATREAIAKALLLGTNAEAIAALQPGKTCTGMFIRATRCGADLKLELRDAYAAPIYAKPGSPDDVQRRVCELAQVFLGLDQ